MALVIRLTPCGKKHHIVYRIRVADKKSRLTGRFVAELGSWDPHAFGGRGFCQIDMDRCLCFLKNGAQPTSTLTSILKKAGILSRDLENVTNNGTYRKKKPISVLLCNETEINIPPVVVGDPNVHLIRDRRKNRAGMLRMDISIGFLFDGKDPAWHASLRVPGRNHSPKFGKALSLRQAGLEDRPVAQIVMRPDTGPTTSTLRMFLDTKGEQNRFASFRWMTHNSLLAATESLATFVGGAGRSRLISISIDADENTLSIEQLDSKSPSESLYDAVAELGFISRVHLFSDDVEATAVPSENVPGHVALTIAIPIEGYFRDELQFKLILELLRETSPSANERFATLANSLSILRNSFADALGSREHLVF